MRSHPSPTLFPYTTLFRSKATADLVRSYDSIIVDLIELASEGDELELAPVTDFASSMNRRASAPVTRKIADRKSTRLNSSHVSISYAVFCLKKKKKYNH